MTEKKNENIFFMLLKNIGAALLTLFILSKVIGMNEGYTWIYQSYLKDNLKIASEYKELPYDQRMMMKLGYDYSYLLYLRECTPTNAVILYPSLEDFRTSFNGQQSMFSGQLNDKLSAIRYLYPRKIIMHEEFGKTSWGHKITHVSIINGKGQEYLPYRVDTTLAYAILPISLPDSSSTKQPK